MEEGWLFNKDTISFSVVVGSQSTLEDRKKFSSTYFPFRKVWF